MLGKVDLGRGNGHGSTGPENSRNAIDLQELEGKACLKKSEMQQSGAKAGLEDGLSSTQA